MNDYENNVLTDFKVFCPTDVIQKYKHKHTNDKNWTRFYYYKDKKRHQVGNENIEFDYEVSSTLAYNKNVFYKMTTMSNQDGFFDYYFKLKNNLPKIVVKKSNRKNQSNRTKNIKEVGTNPTLPPICPESGKFICHFK